MTLMSTEELKQGISDIQRSQAQRDVIMCLLKSNSPLTAKEIAHKLNVSIPAVHIALFRLNKRNLVTKVSRGSYEPNLSYLMSIVLDELLKRRRVRR